MEQILEVKNLHVHYGMIHAIKGLDFHVNKGEIVTLIGANGAGKTSTLQTITGLIPHSQGEIIYRGENVSKLPGYKLVSKGLAHVPEGRRVFASLTVYQNLMLGAYTRKDSKEIEESLNMIYHHYFLFVPKTEGKKKTGRRKLIRRRTADAGHGKSPDVQAGDDFTG